MANHQLLVGRLEIDDPDGWEADYLASERDHGTAMASLIAHGDLNQTAAPLSSPIYVRPIMKPAPWPSKPRPVSVPEDCLAIDLVHRAIRRMFDGDAGEGPKAPQVRIVNLSIGDRGRQFTQSVSPMARLLDWLSVKYGVLFVVSAGNHAAPITLDSCPTCFKRLQASEVEAATIRALYRESWCRKLLSPGESINALTVGAVHYDAAQVAHPGQRFDPFERLLPSPVSAFGGGYRRSVKPDIVFHGGRQWYRLPFSPQNPVSIEPAIFRTSPGNKVASSGSLPGELAATSYACGTSNATALISRAASVCLETLRQILDEQATVTDPQTEAPLLKAMLVHGCSWGDIGSRISEVLRTPENSRQVRGLVSRWLGYGVPQIERVLDCTEQRATLLGFGQLSEGEAHVFRLPLPPSLGSNAAWRRMTVTLAWLSPISATTQKYRTASLWFEAVGSNLVPERTDSDGRTVRRGTVQHEVFEGQKAEPFLDGDCIEIKVNCREDAGKFSSPIAYGIVVSLEVGEGTRIAVYDEIRTRIATAIEIR